MTLTIILNRIIWHAPARVGSRDITVAEAAQAAGVHERKMYGVLEGDRFLRADELRALSIYLVERCHDTRLAEWLLPAAWAVVPLDGATDGRIDDDVAGIVTATADAINAFDADPARAALAADRCMGAAATMKAECRRRTE